MAYLGEYIEVGWQNEPSRATPINAHNLGVMEDGIKRLFYYLLAGGGTGGGSAADGREVELRNSGEYIQWRYSGEEEWVNLVSLADLKGDKGDNYVLTDEDIEEIASKVKVATSADKITYDDSKTQLGATDVQDAIGKVSEQIGNQSGLTNDLKTAFINYYTHVMPNFDDTNGLSYVNAILTALGAETRGESGGEEEPDTPDNPEVTLSSISATYTGGNVTVGTALTDLTGLTVKATYSDGSTKNVTGYTLSGTIAEGSNTITVSYQGKTTTFTVTGIAEETEVTSLRGIQLPSVPTNWSTNDDWQYAGNSGNLYELIGSKYLYLKQVFSGTVYVRTVAKTPYTYYAVGMKLVAEDYLTNQTAEGETLAETIKTIKFNNQFLYVSTDGSEYEYLTSEPDDGRYCVRLQKFDIPEGQVAILYMSPPSSTGTINIDGGWNTVFFEDPTNHITVTEVYE